MFVAAGRFALGPDAPAQFEGGYRARTVGPARHGVLLINPKSGGGKAGRFDLAGEAGRRGVRAIVLGPDDDLQTLAEQAVADGADVLGMAGGDGSQALVAAVAVRAGVGFVCVPAGTRNHFALDLGLDRDDVVGALDAYTDGVQRDVDLATVNGRVFVNNASLGVYAQVVQVQWLPRRQGAHLGSDAAGSPRPVGVTARPGVRRAGRPAPARDAAGAGVQQPLPAEPGGAPRRPAETRHRPPRGGRGPDALLEFPAAEFEVRSASAVPVGVDGEALVMTPPLRFVSLPAALPVRLPRRVRTRRTWRNAALHRDDVTALVRIATGA